MPRFTLAVRALMHMHRYRHIPSTIEFGAPKEITHDGVAEVLGISRSHAAIIMNQLEEEGKVFAGKAKVTGQNRGGPRKVYFITPLGCTQCDELTRLVKEGELDESCISGPTNLNYCSSSQFWALDKEVRDLVGGLMVLRTTVRRGDFDPEPPGIVPFDYRGRMSIKPETREWYLRGADTETLRVWHSSAADWCADHRCDPKERLYHLFKSNRHREAIRLVHSIRFMLMDFPDRESRDIISKLAEDDHQLTLITGRMSLRMGELDIAHRDVNRPGIDLGAQGIALKTEVMLAEGERESALELAMRNYDGSMELALALGMCMTANGRYEEALTYLDRCRSEIRRTGCLFRLDETLRTQSEAMRGLGDEKGADSVWETAECWRKDPQHRYRFKGSGWTSGDPHRRCTGP